MPNFKTTKIQELPLSSIQLSTWAHKCHLGSLISQKKWFNVITICVWLLPVNEGPCSLDLDGKINNEAIWHDVWTAWEIWRECRVYRSLYVTEKKIPNPPTTTIFFYWPFVKKRTLMLPTAALRCVRIGRITILEFLDVMVEIN